MIAPHLPERFAGGVKRFIEQGITPGSFLTAVLENDLKETFAKADTVAIRELPGIVAWLYSYAPADCWGSQENVHAWRMARKKGRASSDGN